MLERKKLHSFTAHQGPRDTAAKHKHDINYISECISEGFGLLDIFTKLHQIRGRNKTAGEVEKRERRTGRGRLRVFSKLLSVTPVIWS